ncbi:MAG: DedA family protein [Candidatus Schekmanbacteria bacterium]|nr:DedA family protein [Candidatus Schekmanbacteria bacterium]
MPGSTGTIAEPITPARFAPRLLSVRGLYDWVLSWAETPCGIWALALISFIESSIFPIPPDVLLIPLVLGARRKWWRLALCCTAASVAGGMLGYAIGWGAWETVGQAIVRFYHGEATMERIRIIYAEWGFLGVFGAALTPIPYKIFTIASGVFAFPIPSFLLASVLGRATRFFAVAGLLYLFGEPLKRFIDRYFNVLSVLFFVLLVGGFLLVKFLAG